MAYFRGCAPLYKRFCKYTTQDGTEHCTERQWDLIIAHPPCTYLSNVCTRAYSPKCNTPEQILAREKKRSEAFIFFMAFIYADCEKIAVENPVGYVNSHYRKPNQIIHPYYFAESKDDKENYVMKRTCLWLKGLKPLQRKTFLDEPEALYYINGRKIHWCEGLSGIHGGHKGVSKARAKTFPAIATAMAEQWGKE